MMRKVWRGILAAVMMLSLPMMAMPAFAQNDWTQEACKTATAEQKAALGCNDGNVTAPKVVTNILQVIISIIGILAAVMIIVGGVQYVTSVGDAAKVAKAKNTIMYSIIGLVVALLAFAIVNFVQGAISG